MATRFIIVSLPRSGTHMLRTLLNQHPDIRAETELFNEHARPCRKWKRRSAPWVLEKLAWHEGRESIRGCVAHLSQGHSWKIWQHLSTLSDVHYLCIRRFNLLEQFLSLQQALIHQRWQIYRDEPCPQTVPMRINPDEADRYFRQTQIYWNQFDDTFSDQPRLTIWYEQLCQQTEIVSQRVQQFLGAKRIAGLEPSTIKVNAPARELISNYDQLRDHFAGSPYQQFFTADEPARLQLIA